MNPLPPYKILAIAAVSPVFLFVSLESVSVSNIEIRGKQNLLFSEGPVFKGLVIYIAGNFEAGNLLNLAVNGGPRSTFAGNSALLRCDFIEFAMLPAQRFWRKTVSLLDVMGARSNQ